MTHFMSSTDLMGMIDLNGAILNRIFSEGLTSIRFLKKWPGPLDSEALRRSSEDPMARVIIPLNFGDQGFWGEGSCSSVLALEEAIRKGFRFRPRSSQVSWVNSFGIF